MKDLLEETNIENLAESHIYYQEQHSVFDPCALHVPSTHQENVPAFQNLLNKICAKITSENNEVLNVNTFDEMADIVNILLTNRRRKNENDDEASLV